jgi:hypothetical protein
MKPALIQSSFIGVVGLFSLLSAARAEIVPYDDLLHAVERTGEGLANDESRKALLSSLEMAIEANSESMYLPLAQSVATDLKQSITKAGGLRGEAKHVRKRPERYLMESKVPVHLLLYRANWPAVLGGYREQHPDDPAILLLTSGRDTIPRLIPLLEDRSPVRSFNLFGLRGVPRIPRTCDYALLLIEYHSRCRFHGHYGSDRYFHQQTDGERKSTIEQVKRWWKQNKMSSVAVGIRNLLQSGWEIGKIEMTQNLVELGNANDAEFAKQVLREMTSKFPGHIVAARALARYGDLSPLKMYYQKYDESLDKGGIIYDSSVVFYMTDHGGRREWELLTKIAEREIEKGLEAGLARVWPALVRCRKSKSSPWAIPALGLALSQTKASGSRSLAGMKGSQAFSYADVAAELLQKQTDEDFGYAPADSAEKRAAAIGRAQEWWKNTGKSKYTFDAIARQVKR